MPSTNASLLDAYNALFSNTPYGELLRKRVMGALQQQVTSPGAGGSGEQSGQNPFGGGGGGSVSVAPNPTAAGSVPGLTPSGSTGASAAYSPSNNPEGFANPGAVNRGMDFGMKGWNNQQGKDVASSIMKYGTPLLGPVLPGLAAFAYRGINALTPSSPVTRFQPGFGMPRFGQTPSFGGFDPNNPAGVMGGYAGYQGGGPDERGGEGIGGVGTGGGAADPDRGGFGGENY